MNLIKGKIDFNKLQPTKFFGILFLFYFLAHGWALFFPNSIYWDDWLLFKSTNNEIIDFFSIKGDLFNFKAYIHIALLDRGIWTYKIIRFTLIFLTIYPINEILKRLTIIKNDANTRFLFLLFYLILPLSFDRVLIITLPNIICLFLFYWGWYFLFKNKLISIILFILSFSTKSLLVFYFLPIAELYFYKESIIRENRLKKISILNFIKQKFYLISLPFIFFILTKIFLKTGGIYSNYNDNFGIYNLLTSIFKQIISDSISFSLPVLPLIILVILINTLFINKISTNNIIKSFELNKKIKFLNIAIFAIALGCFPYWIIGKSPILNNWSTRHQLLMPIGISYLLLFFISLLRNQYKKLFISIIIASSILFNSITYFSLFIDHKKQDAIVNILSNELKNQKIDVALINDKTKFLNAWGREYTFYEWNSILMHALKKDLKKDNNYAIEIDNYYNFLLLDKEKEFYKDINKKLFKGLDNGLNRENAIYYRANISKPKNLLDIKEINLFTCGNEKQGIASGFINNLKVLKTNNLLEKRICISTQEISNTDLSDFFKKEFYK